MDENCVLNNRYFSRVRSDPNRDLFVYKLEDEYTGDNCKEE